MVLARNHPRYCKWLKVTTLLTACMEPERLHFKEAGNKSVLPASMSGLAECMSKPSYRYHPQPLTTSYGHRLNYRARIHQQSGTRAVVKTNHGPNSYSKHKTHTHMPQQWASSVEHHPPNTHPNIQILAPSLDLSTLQNKHEIHQGPLS